MAIILEGPDGAGKTSLARILENLPKFGLEYYHSGGAPGSDEEENEFLQTQLDHANKSYIIIDRLTCVSQQVYRDGRLYDTKLSMWLERTMQSGSILVYCRPSRDHLMTPEKLNWRDVETEAYKQEVIRKQHLFIDRYDMLFSLLPHIHFSFQEPHADELIQMLAAATCDDKVHHKLIQLMMLKSFNPRKFK